MVWIILIALVTSLLGGGGVAYASTDSLPGDALYGVKTLIEDVRLSVADDADALALQYKFAEKRLGEMEALIAQNRLGEVEGALNAYMHALQEMAKIMAKGDPTDPQRTEAELGYLKGIRETQRERLEAMLKDIPEQLRLQLQLAIQNTEQFRLNRPEGAGQPEHAGEPAGQGVQQMQQEQSGQTDEGGQEMKQEQTGQPEESGNPEPGTPNQAGQPDDSGSQGQQNDQGQQNQSGGK